MKKNIILFVFACSFSFLSAQESEVRTQMYNDVEYLASDELEGREPGTMGEIMAAEFIAKRFKDIGLSPKGTEGYLQRFSFTVNANPHATGSGRSGNTVGARNVIGYIDNGAENTVVIGGHFDHLGYGAPGSLYTGEPAIHNGADDNASGIAIMLALADTLATAGPKNNNYLFIAFSGEEQGLLGSNHFVRNATIDIDKVNYMINMDMVGRLNEDKKLSVSATGTSSEWENALKNNNLQDFDLKMDPSGTGPSDHSSFYNAGIPVLHFFTGQHSDYHKPTDDTEKVNFDGMEMLYHYILDIIEDKDDEGKLDYIASKSKEESTRMSFTVTLGVMPDYLYDGEGMRLDGIIAGRVAEKAGLERGDIIIKMGKVEVSDIYSYMDALNQFEKGDKTKVHFLRDGKKKKKKVVFK